MTLHSHRFCVSTCCLAFVLSLTVRSSGQEPSSPLPKAHSHNDYLQNRPLQDALDLGFCSVEADIFFVDGQLLVGHSRLEVSKDRTLKKIYLEPLRQRALQNNGRIHRDGPVFTLLIDIKAEGAKTYQALRAELLEYRDIVSHQEDSRLRERAVSVVISGDRAFDVIAADKTRVARIDGRLSDLDTRYSADLIPLISDNWRNHFEWRGKGKFPAVEKARLDDIVQQAHRKGRKVRFWAAPDMASAWKVLDEADVDMINTDDLSGLSRFLQTE